MKSPRVFAHRLLKFLEIHLLDPENLIHPYIGHLSFNSCQEDCLSVLKPPTGCKIPEFSDDQVAKDNILTSRFSNSTAEACNVGTRRISKTLNRVALNINIAV